MVGCPFCPLERKTRWFRNHPDGVVVCEDLDPTHYSLRLLAVGSGKHWHRPREQYSQDEIDRLVREATEVAGELIRNDEAKGIAGIDYEVSVMNHYHIQVCLL